MSRCTIIRHPFVNWFLLHAAGKLLEVSLGGRPELSHLAIYVNWRVDVNRESSRVFVVWVGVASRKGLFGSVSRTGQRRTLPPADFENAQKRRIYSKKAET